MTTPNTQTSPTLLKPVKPVGIVGYGAYVPRYRIPAKEIARVWTGKTSGLPIKEKAVPGLDEDVINSDSGCVCPSVAIGILNCVLSGIQVVWDGALVDVGF
jgi:hypothetical protein